MDTTKEALVWMYGDKILERGFAALAIEGPGQYEALLRGSYMTPNGFGEAGCLCLDWIDSREDLDSDRVGVFGRSFGSYVGLVLASANANRVKAAAVGLVCHEPGLHTLMEESSPTHKARFMFMSGYTDEDAFDEFISGFDLRNAAQSLTCPSLIVGGELDELSPIEHTYDLLRVVPGPTDLVVYEGERHAMGERESSTNGPHWYSLMADWLVRAVIQGRDVSGDRYRFIRASGEVVESDAIPSGRHASRGP
jgi:hypothetical protein